MRGTQGAVANGQQLHIPAASLEKGTATGIASAVSSTQHKTFVCEVRVPMFDLTPITWG